MKKKRFIVISIVQFILMLLMFVYAFVQQLEAKRQEQLALEAKDEALRNQLLAEEQRVKLIIALDSCNRLSH